MVTATTDGRNIRILVADDNRDAANALTVLLSRWGFEVSTAFDGQSALEKARVFHPDLMLLDIAMPRLDGCAVAERIRDGREYGNPKLIAVTAFDSDDHRRRAQQAGFDLYFVKSGAPAALNEAIRRVL
jgi:DNA-binding response OmpR family regulator